MAVCSEIHTKHINTLCGQNTQYLTAELKRTIGNHMTLKASITHSFVVFLIPILRQSSLASHCHKQLAGTFRSFDKSFLMAPRWNVGVGADVRRVC